MPFYATALRKMLQTLKDQRSSAFVVRMYGLVVSHVTDMQVIE